jgi:hypothetical protein
MEEYVNEDTIIKNETYELLKENIICPICLCLMIEPVICLKCQNTFCKNCIVSWQKKNNSCPNRCDNPNIKDVIGKNNFITKFKFKCIKGCGEIIPFEDIKKHYSSDCLSKKKKKKTNILSKEEAAKYKKENKCNIPHMTSM